MNLFSNIFDQLSGQAQPQVPSFSAPQAPRTTNYTQPVQPTAPVVQKPSMTLFSDEQKMFQRMKADNLSDDQSYGMLKKRRTDLLGGDGISADETKMLLRMQADNIPVKQAVAMIQKRRQDMAEKANSIHDLHADEGVVEQTLKAPFRAIGDVASQTWQGIGKGTEGLLDASFRGVNDLNKMIGSSDYSPELEKQLPQGGYLGDVAKIGAGTTGAVFNLGKAPLALGINTANQLPGAQYITQGIGKGIQYGAEQLGGLAGVDKETSMDLATTGMNLFGMKPGMNTLQYGKGIVNAPGVMGKAGAIVKPVGGAIVDTVKMPYDIAKGTAKLGISTTADIAVQAPKKLVRSGVSALEKIKPGIKDDLANIDPPSRYAVERATPERVSSIIEEAKQAKMNPEADYQQTPYHKGAEMANKTVDTIEGNLRKRQAERMSILENVPLEKVNLENVRNSLKSELDKLNIEDITIDDVGKPVVVSKKGRSALLDSKNSQDMQAIEKLREILSEDVSPLQTMDNIKILQEWLYENKGTIALKGISKKMEGIVSKVQGSLNKTFKDQLPPEYKKVMDSMSEDIKMNDKIKRLFGIGDDGNPVGNRGELVMKRLTNGTTTGGEARTLAKEILDKYGIDLIQEARLRQLSMELVGDTRGANLFGVLLSGKKGMMDWAMGKVGDVLIDKENLIKSYAGKGTIIKPKKQSPLYTKPKQNGTPIRNTQNNTPISNTKGSTKVTPKKQERDLLQEKYDAEQKNAKPIVIKKPIVKPNTIKNESKVNKPVSSDTIPEGYWKNGFGEIVKNPSNKKGGFIKIPEIGKKTNNPIVNEKTGETLNQAIEKLRGYGWEESKIQKFKNTVLGKGPKKIIYPKGTITSVNPTSSLFVDYNPQSRMTAPLAKNIVTLDKTSGKSPDTIVTIYRGAPKIQKEINPGDFITTNYDNAKSYTNDKGVVLSKKVKMSDILDDMEDPSWNGGEEYLYRPTKKVVSRDSRQPTVKNPLVEEARKMGIDLNKYFENVSEKSAIKMADYASDIVEKKMVKGERPMDMSELGMLSNKINKNEAGGNISTVGDILKDSELRKLYEKSLDTPITILDERVAKKGQLGGYVPMGEGRYGGHIVLFGGNKEISNNLPKSILHEAAHAIRDSKGRSLVEDYRISPIK